MNERYSIVETPTEVQIILKKPEYSFSQEEIKKLREEYEKKGYVFAGKDVFLGGLEGIVFKKVQTSQPQVKSQITIPQEVQTRPDIIQLSQQHQQIQQQIQQVEHVERRIERFEDVKQRAKELISTYEQALEKYKDVKSAEDVARLAGYFSKLSSDIRLFIERELKSDYPEIVALRNQLSEISRQSMNITYSLLQQKEQLSSGEYEIDTEKAQEFVQNIRSSLSQISQDISSMKLNITKEEISQAKSKLYEAKNLIESELQQRAQITFQPTKEEYMKAFQLIKEIEEWKKILNDPKYKQYLTPEVVMDIWKEIKKKEGELAELYLYYPEMQKVIPEIENYFKNPFAQIGYGIQAILGRHFWEYPVKFVTEKSEGVGKLFEEALVEAIVGRTLKPITTREGFLEAHKEFWLEGAGTIGTGYVIGAGIGAIAGTAVSKGPTLISKIGGILKPITSRVEPFVEPVITNIKFYGGKIVHNIAHNIEKVGEKISAIIPEQNKAFGAKAGEIVKKGVTRGVTNPNIVFAMTEAGVRGYEAAKSLAMGEDVKEVGEKIASEVLRDVAVFYAGRKGFEEAYEYFGTKKVDSYLLAKSRGMKEEEMAEYLRSLKRPEELEEKLKSVEEYKVYEVEGKDSLARVTKISKEKPIVAKDIIAKSEIPVEEILKEGKVIKEEYPFKLIEYKGELYLFSSVPPKKVVESDLINILKLGKEYEKGISIELLTPDNQDIGLFRVSAKKTLYLPVAEEEEKVGLRVLPKTEPSKSNLLKDLAEYYKKQMEKELVEKTKEIPKVSVTSEGKSIVESVEKSAKQSAEKAIEKELTKTIENIAGVKYTFVVKPPEMKIPILPFTEFKFINEPIEEKMKKGFGASASLSVLSTNMNFINKVESSLSNMLKSMQKSEISRTQITKLTPSQITTKIKTESQTKEPTSSQEITPQQITEKTTPPRTYTTTTFPEFPFVPTGIKFTTRSPPPKISLKLPGTENIERKNLKSFEKMFGLQKAKYEPSLIGLMFGIKARKIDKLFTGFEIRGIPLSSKRR
jgi:predicted nucleotidyltransferase